MCPRCETAGTIYSFKRNEIMQEDSSVSPLALGGAVTGILVLICSVIYLFFRSSTTKQEKLNDEIQTKSEIETKKQSTKSKPVKPDPKQAAKFTHPWLSASLRAHSSSINGLDFSHNDKYLASAAEDDSVLLWLTKDFDGKDHK